MCTGCRGARDGFLALAVSLVPKEWDTRRRGGGRGKEGKEKGVAPLSQTLTWEAGNNNNGKPAGMLL